MPETRVFEVLEAPEFLGAGDFDADGHLDVVTAAAGSQALQLLLGDGQGGFGPADQIALPGAVTALTTGETNQPDGLTDIIVGIVGRDGPEVLVFESPEGALRAEPAALARSISDFGFWILDLADHFNPQSAICNLQSEEPVAILPMRLNGDAVSDFVILTRNQSAPMVALSAPMTTFTVNSTGDGGDSDLSDGICNDGMGNCTLRAAIEQANASPDADAINFNIPGAGVPTISLTSALPSITSPVRLDGTTQPAGLVILNGAGAGVAIDGLTITAGSSVVRGLVIHRFDKNGIRVETNGGNIIERNYIGTDVMGATALSNSFDGISVSSPGNTIGGTVAAARNVISGNGFHGIEITGSAAAGNIVQGNYIGPNAMGTVALTNSFHGVYINGAPGTIVGGTAQARNVISGNWDGIRIAGISAVGSLVQGNYIGTNAAGTRVLGNSGEGVFINGAARNVIGGTTTGARNVISGNNSRGIFILGSAATENRVQGNYIGTNAAGTVALSNGIGVFINNAPGNLIGGETAGAGNVISGNGDGVRIAGSGATGNQVQGNLIGTNANGSAAVANSQDGVAINDAPRNLIGGATVGARNVISGNSGRGVFIFGSGATGTVVKGNYIGTNASGSAAVSNIFHGVFINNVANNTIWQNVISGNNLIGILIYGNGARGNQVEGNFIGADATGANPVENSVGVFITESASNNMIGMGNIIAFNAGDGVYVQSGTGNAILSNSIFANGTMGINLAPGGLTSNDDIAGNEDADTGANNLQNCPRLGDGGVNDGTLIVSYAVTSAIRNSVYPVRVEFFKADAAGQGKTFLGLDIYTVADRIGAVTKTVTFASPEQMKTGDHIVATATDMNGNTSEFSAMASIIARQP
ncbi:MAG: right-handed parallel beta-helix repeat-containing protein [Acidobacteria bacterium]|nr:right-handed parallel beta-helix repeat-containing protein [Acidobacteriota bacterium]